MLNVLVVPVLLAVLMVLALPAALVVLALPAALAVLALPAALAVLALPLLLVVLALPLLLVLLVLLVVLAVPVLLLRVRFFYRRLVETHVVLRCFRWCSPRLLRLMLLVVLAPLLFVHCLFRGLGIRHHRIVLIAGFF